MAAPVVASYAIVDSANTTSGLAYTDIPVPSGVSAGSLVVVAVYGDWYGIGDASSLLGLGGAFTPPDASWHFSGLEMSGNQNSYKQYLGWWYKYATGADSGSYRFTSKTVDGKDTSNVDYLQGGASARITGGPTSGNPFVDSGHSAYSNSTGTVTIASFTPGGNNSLLLAAFMDESGPASGNYTYPSGWSNSTTTVGIVGLGWLGQTTAAATGSLIFGGGENDNSGALVATIRISSPSGIQVPVTTTTISALSPVVSGVRNVHPIVEYGFNEGAGSIAHDSSGNGYNLTVSSSIWASGHTYNGIIPTATSPSARAIGSGVMTSMTVMAWVKTPSSWPGSGSDINIVGDDDGGWYFDITSSGNLATWMQTGGIKSTNPLPTNTWCHLTHVVSGTTHTLYVNGSSVSTTTNGSAPTTLAADRSEPWYIGTAFGDEASGTIVTRTIDDVRIFDSALSSSDVSAFMSTPVTTKYVVTSIPVSTITASALSPSVTTGPSSNLLAAYNFDESDGNYPIDYSGYGRNATGQTGSVRVTGHTGNAIKSYTSLPAVLMGGDGSVGNSGVASYLSQVRAISAWVYYDSSFGAGSFPIMFLDTTQNATFGWYDSGGNISVRYRTGTGDGTSFGSTFASLSALSGWHHWAVSINASGYVSAWLDGGYSSGAEELFSYTGTTRTTDHDALVIDTTAKGWLVDDLRIYSTSIDTDQVISDMSTPVGSSPSTVHVPQLTTTVVAGVPSVSSTHISLPPTISQYSFDEQKGTVAHDSSGNDFDIVVANSSWVSGKNSTGGTIGHPTGGNSVLFGVDNETYPEYSISLDFNLNGTLPNNTSVALLFFEKTILDTTNGEIYLGKGGSGQLFLEFAVYNSGWTEVWGYTPVDETTWHTVCLTVANGTDAVLYLDGAQVASGTVPEVYSNRGYIAPPSETATMEAIGGSIDNLRFFDSILTSDQISALSSIPVPPVETYGYTVSSIPTLVSAMSALVPGVSALPAKPFVTSVSPNKRYLVDQYGAPIFYRQECAWFIPAEDSSRWPTYFASRQSYGINIVEIAPSTNNSGTTGPNGIPMFNASDGLPVNFNQEWLDNLRTFIDMAATYGMTVLMNLGYAWEDQDGWTTATDFAQMLIDNFGTCSNLLWSFGVDYNANEWATYNTAIIAIREALRTLGDTKLSSIQNYNPTTSSDNTGWASHIDFESGYTYQPSYDVALRAYSRGIGPVVLVETNFEGENNQGGPATNAETIRRTTGWMVTSGGVGVDYGRRGIYNPPDSGHESDWETLLSSTYLPQQQAMVSAVKSINWWKLVPDTTNSFLTSGQGTKPTSGTQTGTTGDSPVDPLESSYATAAIASDKTVALIYTPTSRAITIDTSKLGANPVGYRVDPTTGGTTSFTVTGSLSAPGNNASGSSDWLYVFIADIPPATVNAPQMAVTVSASNPTVVGVRNSSTSAPKVTIAVAAGIPSVSSTWNASVVVPVSSVTLSAHQPGVSGTQTASVAAPALTVSSVATSPVVSAAQNPTVSASVTHIQLTTLTPTVSSNSNAMIVVPSVEMTTFAPVPSIGNTGNVEVDVPKLEIVVDTPYPSVITGTSGMVILSAPAAISESVPLAPSVYAVSNQTVSVPTVAITLFGDTPSVEGHTGVEVQSPASNITVGISVPDVSGQSAGSITPNSVQVTLSAKAPQIVGQQNNNVLAPTLTVFSVAPVPSVSAIRNILVLVPASNTDIQQLTPDVFGTRTVLVDAPKVEVSLSAKTPIVQAGGIHLAFFYVALNGQQITGNYSVKLEGKETPITEMSFIWGGINYILLT